MWRCRGQLRKLNGGGQKGRMAQTTIEICYYSSDFYAPYTGISMYSLCKNNEGLDFQIGCIDTGISDINKKKMQQLAAEFGRTIVFHDFSALESYIRDELKLPLCNGSYATYIKVFPDRIFKDVERILFMDGDTIIRASIRPLLEMNIDSYVFAATKVSLINEKWVYKENRPDNLRLQYSLKFKDAGYYNIGVFYANLRRWAEVDFGSQIMAMKEQHLSTISQAPDVPIDEMLINLAALAHKNEKYVLPVPAIFNSTVHNIPHYRALRANLCCGYIEKASFNKAYYAPVVIHYCIFKPWYTDTYSPFRRVLEYYKARSPWPDAFTDKLYKTIPEKFFGKVVYSMPTESMMQFTIRLGHFYLRTRGRAKNKIALYKEKFIKFWRPKSEKIKRWEINAPHFVKAFLRRGGCLLRGDIKTAFAWPKDWLESRRK